MPLPLPPPVARFADLATRLHPGPIETVVLDTNAWMRRPWWAPIPLRIRMSHELGVAFVHQIRIGRGALSFDLGRTGVGVAVGLAVADPPARVRSVPASRWAVQPPPR